MNVARNQEGIAARAGAFLHRPAVVRWGLYFAKVVVLLGLLFAASRMAGSLPPVAIALLWAILSGASALGIAYRSVVRKTYKQVAYTRGGVLARLNSGRTLVLLAAFAASAACMAGLMLESAKWAAPEWCLVAASALVYPLVCALVTRFLGREYEPAFRIAKTTTRSALIVCVLLCAAYFVLVLAQPAADYASATEAFESVNQPFENSPSALMAEAGRMTALVDGLTAYGTAKAAEASLTGYLVWRIVLSISAFLGVASLLSLCSLEWRELKRVFLPLEAGKDEVVGAASSAARPVVRKYAIAAGALPILLVAAFLVTDAAFANVAQTEEFTAAEQFVRDQVGVAVYVLDGAYYEHQAVQGLIDETKAKSADLSQEARETLVPLINESFDARLNNVDSYLDWYYSLPADYERLVTMVTGTVEDYVAGQFTSKIGEGVDDTQLDDQLANFTEQANALKADFEAGLEGYKLEDVPDWLVTAKEALASFQMPEPTQKLIDAGARLGLGAGTSLATGTVAKQVTKKALGKPFITEVVKRITSALSSRGVGAAVGGVLGTAAGPVGTAAGVVAGTAAGVGVDFGLLKLDELMNRDQYRQEIVDTIEEDRAELLAVVE